MFHTSLHQSSSSSSSPCSSSRDMNLLWLFNNLYIEIIEYQLYTISNMNTTDNIATVAAIISFFSMLWAFLAFYITKKVFDRDNIIEISVETIDGLFVDHTDLQDDKKICRAIKISSIGDRFLYLYKIDVRFDWKEIKQKFPNIILYKEKTFSFPIKVPTTYNWSITLSIDCVDQMDRDWAKIVTLTQTADSITINSTLKIQEETYLRTLRWKRIK